VFVTVLAGEHATSALDPLDHTISEYARGSNGWVMACGLAAWGASLAAVGALATRAIVRWPLLLAAAGLSLAAAFPTQAVAAHVPAGEPRTTAGVLHDIGSGVGTAALTIAIVASLATGRRRPAMIACVAGAWVAYGALLIGGDPVPGVRQRVIVAAAVGWQALTLRASR
jgi:hypothetical protein